MSLLDLLAAFDTMEWNIFLELLSDPDMKGTVAIVSLILLGEVPEIGTNQYRNYIGRLL